MKFIKNILIGFIVTTSLMSCVDYLDKETDTELTLPLVFEDKTRIEGWKEITGSFFRNVFGRLIFSLRTYTHYQHRV